ncbi:MAG: 2-C-methyl-D-erythritol 2,4-cyclodiphosphate synthase [Chthoniobacterales bacterium]|nr:2-C-methyl-D-erythritol 2,4-cyclodiphosphate synthase [Chthoniobacterales bacterium]MCX7712366.1 2-C-methyl-D-erythritol 2,4-cyclodiphosphate synthase [Chthoniobacterales bacterium]
MNIRIGIGYDVHRVCTGRQLVLGGVLIDSSFGLEGHSDGDVLSHAIADALLGAAGFQDIGYFFPNSDPTLEGVSSQVILRRVREILYSNYIEISNVDATLICEEPKIAPYITEMRKNLASSLDISIAQIGIKATTNEKLGFIGRGEGMAAFAAACIVKKS